MTAEEHLREAESYAIDAKQAVSRGSNLVHGYVALANLHIRLSQMRAEPEPPRNWIPAGTFQIDGPTPRGTT